MKIYVQDDVIDEEYIDALCAEIQRISVHDAWTKKFIRAGSEMYEFNDVPQSMALAATIAAICVPWRLDVMADLMETGPLIPDPYLIGAGFSVIKDGGDLKWHVDFNWNDRIKLYRAVSMIIYLDEPESGGVLEFEIEHEMNKVEPKKGRVVLFTHSETIRHRVTPVVGSRSALRLFFYTSNLEAPEGYHRSLYGVDENGKPTDVVED